MLKIAIDPGHGYGNLNTKTYDPGAVSGGTSEAEIVLQWALTGKWVLTQAGIPVWLSRDDDRDVAPVALRDDMATNAGCTHFVSLHCNAGPILATGTETFYRDDNDKPLADIAQYSALQALGLRNRGVKNEGASQHPRLAILDFDGPACLLELGFITNPGDRSRLKDRERRVAFWREFVRAFRAQYA